MRNPCGDGFGFEKLDVWHKAMDFADEVYDLTKQFPREELFGLTVQLRRASVSVPANIAEGTSRSSRRDQARFFEIAYGSLNEILTMLILACRRGFVKRESLDPARSGIAQMCRMLSGLRNSALGEDK